MKKFLVFTTLFLSSLFRVTACGYSPYGEDVRYSLFLPSYFDYSQYHGFYYNNFLWGYNNLVTDYRDASAIETNIFDWYNYTGKKVPIDEIVYFNQNMKLTDIDESSTNQFLQFLYKNKRKDVIKYFIYAKKCEGFNSYNYEQSWERDQKQQQKSAALFIQEMKRAYHAEKDPYLKRKYAFQCIRLAFYNAESDLISAVFNEEFRNTKKDYLYYWSLYFNSFDTTKNGNYNTIAELFANSPEKAFASQFYFIGNFNLKKALQFAKTPEQVGNLYAYASARVLDKNLENLKLIYQNKPQFKTLDFLLLREINKIEDWVYTPYYTNYSPSTQEYGYYGYYNESETSKITTETLRQRSSHDRLYAREVLDFINQCDLSKVENPVLWKASKIQLLFITQQYDLGLKEIREFELHHKNEKIAVEIEKIKALCLTARQAKGKGVILPEVHSIIEKNTHDKRFLFAVGRELEFNGNLLDGIALISISSHDNYWDEEYDSTDVEWRGNRLLTTSNLDVFYNYFDYLDFVYSARDLHILINKLGRISAEDKNDFIYRNLLKNKNYLTDLLGTKYIREENISMALKIFRSLGDQYWQDNYNSWERGKFDESMLFDENPFYTIKHTPDFIEKKELFFVNKLSVTEHLAKYLQRANDVKRKDRDYYYFLVGNCYLNMSDMGNSWMMRRFQSYSSFMEEYLNESYIDNIEYRTRVKTVEYYHLAYQNSKSEKFKALCLHMMDYAQDYNIKTEHVKSKYPQYYEDLSNCVDLDEFFTSR